MRGIALLVLLMSVSIPPAHSANTHSKKETHCRKLEFPHIVALKPTTGTVSSAIARDPKAKKATRKLLRLFGAIHRSRDEYDPSKGGVRQCTNKSTMWCYVRAEVAAFRWGRMKECTYMLPVDMPPPNFAPGKAVFDTIRGFHDAIKPYGRLASESYGLNWENVFPAGVLVFDPPDNYRQCRLARALGYRFRNRWTATAVFSNHSAESVVRNRGTFREVISMDDANVTRAVPFSKPTYTGNTRTKTARESGTALLREMSGSVPPSHFHPYDQKHFFPQKLDRTACILKSLDDGNLEREMVEDSDTLSYLAILLLPVVLALAPIALFQDASTLATVVYAIVTDVVSVMPLAIKGIELIVYGSRRHYAFSADMHGMASGSQTVVVEAWAAECGMKPFVREKGIVLLAVAVTAMVFGVWFEFFARGWVHRRAKGKMRDKCGVEEEDGMRRRLSGKSVILKGNSFAEYASFDLPLADFATRIEPEKRPWKDP